jgi:hypothetical protein
MTDPNGARSNRGRRGDRRQRVHRNLPAAMLMKIKTSAFAPQYAGIQIACAWLS